MNGNGSSNLKISKCKRPGRGKNEPFPPSACKSLAIFLSDL
jgi:hypothetical protein